MNNAPEGFILHDVAGTEEDGSPSYFTRKDNGEAMIDLQGPVYIEIPVDEAGFEQVFGDYTTTFRTPDGPKELRGNTAALARKATHDFESAVSSVKTKLRKGQEMSEAEIRESLRTWWTGTSSRPTVQADSLKEAQEAGPEALAEYLESRGIAVK